MAPVYKLEFSAPMVKVPPGSRVLAWEMLLKRIIHLDGHDWFVPCAGRSEGLPKWFSTRGGNGLTCKAHQAGDRGLEEASGDDVTDSWGR